ncbi:OmpA/MotB family protein [Desulfospira joergensenii]|uniref:OmpA/MotB family protein n=1 Tax=Desulfospira joergensenii TaxID=53329 RepID=UPI000A03DA6E|nr:OmpA family protein [Desulfospira joergensenii]
MGRLSSGVRICFLSVFLVFVFLIPSQSSAGYYEKKLLDTEAYDTIELKLLIDQTQARANVLTDQIKSIKKEIDWLILKINRINDAGRKPSPSLKNSVTAKEERIQILKKEKNRLTALNTFYTKEYDSRQNMELGKILEKKIGLSPEKNQKIETKPIVAKVERAVKEVTAPGPSVKRTGIEASIKKNGLENWVEVSGDDTCLRINTTLPILFSSGSAQVAKEYRAFLKKLALFLKPYDVKVMVNGYADTDPIRTKKYPSNLELGASRAANIVHELVKQGLKPSIFQIGTTGEYRFAAKQPSKQKSFHRRAQVTVIFTG